MSVRGRIRPAVVLPSPKTEAYWRAAQIGRRLMKDQRVRLIDPETYVTESAEASPTGRRRRRRPSSRRGILVFDTGLTHLWRVAAVQ